MKHLFKKGALPVLALGAAMMMVVSCGQTSVYSGNPKELEATIVWWNNYEEPELGDNLTEEEARQDSDYREYYYATDLIAEFNEIYPKITVQSTYIGSYSTIQEQVNQGLGGGNTPNIASCYGDHVAGYYNSGATLAMDKYIQDPNIGFGKGVDAEGNITDDATTSYDDFNQSYLNAEKGMYASNELLSLPYSKSSETLAVNVDVFEKVGAGECGTTVKDGYTAPVAAASKKAYSVPTNWKELIALARQMKADFPELFGDDVQKNSDGYFNAVPFCYDSSENMVISFFEMAGIDYTDATGNGVTNQVLFNNADAKAMLVQLKKWNNEGLIATQNQLPITNAALGYHAYSSDMFADGKIFMCLSSTAGARYFATDGVRASLNPTPTFTKECYDGATGTVNADAHKVISQGPSLTFFEKADDNQNVASWLFYKFLTNTENSATLATNTAYFPLRTSSYNTKAVKEYTNAAQTSVTTSSSYNDKRVNYIGQALNLNQTYLNADDYFLSDVFDYSSTARTAVGNMITTIFDNKTAKTDAEITALVDQAVSDAYNTAIGAN